MYKRIEELAEGKVHNVMPMLSFEPEQAANVARTRTAARRIAIAFFIFIIPFKIIIYLI